MIFKELETQYQEISKQLKLSEYLIPLNLQEEKQRFLKAHRQGHVYNPQFCYQQLNVERNQIDVLRELQSAFSALRGNEFQGLIDLYVDQIIGSVLTKIQRYSENRNTDDFIAWLTTDYEPPATEYVAEASRDLEIIVEDSVPEPQTIAPEEMLMHMRRALEERDFEGWNVVVKPMVARISVNSVQKTVSICQHAMFETSSVNRLIVHEIDTHARRSVNGTKQPYLFLRTGIETTETEEGLATLAEYRSGYRDIKDIQRSALRLIACHKSTEMGFHELFEYVLPYVVKPEKAFDLVARIKRGISDTERTGGWLKDQVYYKGFTRLKLADNELLKKLFLGKVALEQIVWINQLYQPLNYDLAMPAWIDLPVLS